MAICAPPQASSVRQNLRLGDRIAPVLETQIAASPQRFRGIRHGGAWVEPGVLPNGSVAARGSTRPAVVPHLLLIPPSARLRVLAHLRLSFRGWVYHTQIVELMTWRRRFRTRRSSSIILVGRFSQYAADD